MLLLWLSASRLSSIANTRLGDVPELPMLLVVDVVFVFSGSSIPTQQAVSHRQVVDAPLGVVVSPYLPFPVARCTATSSVAVLHATSCLPSFDIVHHPVGLAVPSLAFADDLTTLSLSVCVSVSCSLETPQQQR